MRTRWIQSVIDKKLRSPEDHAEHMNETTPTKTARVLSDIEPYKSVVDGSIISSRSKLRSHNKRNNVVLAADYGNQAELNRKEITKVFKAGSPERIESIRKSISQLGGDY